MIGKIGRPVTEKEIAEMKKNPMNFFRNLEKGVEGGFLDPNYKRFISVSDFYSPESEKTSLNWEELKHVDEESRDSPSNPSCYITVPQGFNGLLDILCEELTKKGLMSMNFACEGDYYLENFHGVEVTIYTGRDSYGWGTGKTKYFYPRRLEDAEEYSRYFLNRTGEEARITQVISITNYETDISREYYRKHMLPKQFPELFSKKSSKKE